MMSWLVSVESAINLNRWKSRGSDKCGGERERTWGWVGSAGGVNSAASIRKTTHGEKRSASWSIINLSKRHLLNFSYFCGIIVHKHMVRLLVIYLNRKKKKNIFLTWKTTKGTRKKKLQNTPIKFFCFK